MKGIRTRWDFGLSSDKGPVRKVNEDHAVFHKVLNQDGYEAVLALVADGMGGYCAGDLASQIAGQMIVEWWDRRIRAILCDPYPMISLAKELNERLYNINDQLLLVGKSEGIQLGTTLSVLLLFRGQYLIYHVGDSRIYMKDCGKSPEAKTTDLAKDCVSQPFKHSERFLQLTQDQSWVALQVRKGKLTKEEARNHYRRNVLLQCLGVDSELAIFQRKGMYTSGDLFLLCSDGFHSVFSDRQIRKMLCRSGQDLQKTSQTFVDWAAEAGATDNITVMLIKSLDPSSGAPGWRNWIKKSLEPFQTEGKHDHLPDSLKKR